MKPEEIPKKLEKFPEFNEWRKKNKESFLSYLFKILPGEEEWQAGYYSKKKDNITTFKLTENNMEIIPEQEVFKKEETDVFGLELDKVKVSLEEALGITNKLRAEKYKVDSTKIIVILQKLGIGQVWNITYITSALSTLNVKIDSSSGEVLSEELVPLVKYKDE
ncbi:hypothetical protein CMO89_03155 [Candidatus Woesearchaeota archaeon]|nr:hypothetical protein [Candidatus Woesearchaeota archaeon]|tara:strand:+ start:3564 stop:4055 length:492 start_codon:yes stop_codon:yes gene_type:complete